VELGVHLVTTFGDQWLEVTVDGQPASRTAIDPKVVLPGPLFVSYRRGDSHDFTMRLADFLADHYEVSARATPPVFVDTDGIVAGTGYPEQLTQALRKTFAMIAVIGPDWRASKDSGTNLHDEHDWVRRELEAALGRIPVFPVLIDTTPPPGAASLPQSLTALAALPMLKLRREQLRTDVRALYEAIERYHEVDGVESASRVAGDDEIVVGVDAENASRRETATEAGLVLDIPSTDGLVVATHDDAHPRRGRS
jgi:hypothetical protein